MQRAEALGTVSRNGYGGKERRECSVVPQPDEPEIAGSGRPLYDGQYHGGGILSDQPFR